MKTKIIFAVMLALATGSWQLATAQVAGRSTRVVHGSTLPVGAEQYSEFILTSGSPQVYLCNAHPCLVSGDWVTNSGSVAGANIALSNLSGVAVNTALVAASGVTMT